MRIFEKKKYKTCVLCALCTASLLLTALPALPASAAQMEEPFEAAQAQGSDEALQAGFETMAEERPVQATVITPQGAVVTAAEGEEPLCVLPAGSQVLLLSPQGTHQGRGPGDYRCRCDGRGSGCPEEEERREGKAEG